MVTDRFQDTHQFELKNIGSNHREIVLALNNEDGNLPFVTKEVEGKFGMPVELLWEVGLSLSTIFKLQKPWSWVQAYCHQILSNVTLHDELKRENFDVAIVDLIYNECGLALAHEVLDETPVMAYWAFSLSGGEAEFTTMATPPSHVPCFMSEVSDQMQFHERMWNTAIKFFFVKGSLPKKASEMCGILPNLP